MQISCHHYRLIGGMCQESVDMERNYGVEGLRVNSGKIKVMTSWRNLSRVC